MANIIDLIMELQDKSVQIWAKDEEIKINAPKGAMTPDLLQKLKENKRELLTFLKDIHAGNGGSQDVFNTKATADRPLSLSFAQQRVWFLQQLEKQLKAYNKILAFQLYGSLDKAILTQSIHHIVERHESLRTVFITQDDLPVQEVRTDLYPELEIHIDSGNELFLHLIEQETNRIFDLEKGPLIRFHLIERETAHHILVVNAHHIIFDAWSARLFIQELGTVYAAKLKGLPVQLPEVPFQYVDFTHWQRTQFEKGAWASQLQYWKTKLSGIPQQLSLVHDKKRPVNQAYRGAAYSFFIDKVLLDKIKSAGKEQSATLFMVAMAIYSVLLARHSRQNDVVIGFPIANRPKKAFENLIGFFVNTLVLRTELSGNPSFKRLLERVRNNSLEAYANQDFPFEILVDELGLERSLSHNPLFQTMLVLENPPALDRFSDELTISAIDIPAKVSKFDLTLFLNEEADGLKATFEYNPDLFTEKRVRQLSNRFVRLAEQLCSDPERNVLSVPLLTSEESNRILYQWNQTEATYPLHKALHRFFEEQAEIYPDRPAVHFVSDTLSYQQLNNRANQLAHFLQAQGIQPESFTGVCMERSFDMIVTLLAVLKLGAAYVPIDPHDPLERQLLMIEDSKIPFIVSHHGFLGAVEWQDVQVFQLENHAEQIASFPVHDRNIETSPDAPIYAIFTSGSTGRPKGVVNTHKGVCNRLLWMANALELTREDIFMQKTQYCFDVSVWELFLPLMIGAQLVIAEPEEHKDPARLARLIQQQSVTVIHFVPSMLRAFLKEEVIHTLTSLQKVICSGEALTKDIAETFYQKLNAALHNLYGPTEAAIDVTHWYCPREWKEDQVPIGRPIHNIRIHILDEYLHPVPPGIPGELMIGGIGLAKEYINRPELTKEKFIFTSFNGEAPVRLYRTGDLAYYSDEGVIYYLSRIDHQLKVNGFRIEPGEIESALRLHGSIADVIVRPYRDPAKGETQIICYYTQKADTIITTTEIRAFLKNHLPDFMIPHFYIYLQEIPFLPNGKINYHALPLPDKKRNLSTSYQAPRNELEAKLVEIWQETLSIAKVGIHDNFFDLGGASMLSIKMVSLARQKGIVLDPQMVFKHQTIAELAHNNTLNQPAMPAFSNNGEDQAKKELVQFTRTIETVQATAHGNMKIESLGTYFPDEVVPTEEIVEGCKVKLEFPLKQLTGVHSRHIARKDEFAIDMARNAVKDCLKRSRYQPEDIQLVISSNISRYNEQNRFYFEPGTAIQLIKDFGFTNAIGFDVSNACAGTFTALYIANSYLRKGIVQRILVVSGEYLTHLTKHAQQFINGFMDQKLACLTVGDSGIAMVLDNATDDYTGFHFLEMFTLGQHWHYSVGKMTREDVHGPVMNVDAFKIAGIDTKIAVQHAVGALRYKKWKHDTFQHVILHNTSKTRQDTLIHEINTQLGTPVINESNYITSLERRGNTASTSHFVAIMDAIMDDRIHNNDRVLFGTTGSGVTIGSGLYVFDDLPGRMRSLKEENKPADKLSDVPANSYPMVCSKPKFKIAAMGRATALSNSGASAINLLLKACKDLFNKTDIHKNHINLVIHSGIYRDDFISEPSVATIIAGSMEMNTSNNGSGYTFAFDLLNGSTGFLNSCNIAMQMIHENQIKAAMVLASDIENNAELQPDHLLNIHETAAAMLIVPSETGDEGFGTFVFRNFTEHLHSFKAYSTWNNQHNYLDFYKDPQLETYFIECICKTFSELREVEGIDIDGFDWIFPPQISASFIAKLCAALGASPEKCVDVTEDGVIYTSSVVFALEHVREQQLTKKGDKGLIITAGSGIQVCCAVYHF